MGIPTLDENMGVPQDTYLMERKTTLVNLKRRHTYPKPPVGSFLKVYFGPKNHANTDTLYKLRFRSKRTE